MELIRTLLSRCAALFRSQKLDADLDEELRAHIDLAIEENLKRGMSRQTGANSGAPQLRRIHPGERVVPHPARIAIPRSPRPRSAFRPASISQVARICVHRGAHPRPRHRRKHRDLLRGQSSPARPAAIQRSQPDRRRVDNQPRQGRRTHAQHCPRISRSGSSAATASKIWRPPMTMRKRSPARVRRNS